MVTFSERNTNIYKSCTLHKAMFFTFCNTSQFFHCSKFVSILGENDYRGGDGPLHVSQGSLNNPLFQAFINAAMQAGYEYTSDMNGYQQAGFGPMDMTIYKGKRWNTANAYLKPALSRSNLVALTQTSTKKLDIENNRVVGVDCHSGGRTVAKIRATKEVSVFVK